MIQGIPILEKLCVEVAEMLMLRWMSGHTLNDLFQNKDIRKGFGVVFI